MHAWNPRAFSISEGQEKGGGGEVHHIFKLIFTPTNIFI